MNFILTRDKAITIAPAALKLSGIPDDAKLELTTLDGAVILPLVTMTAPVAAVSSSLSAFWSLASFRTALEMLISFFVGYFIKFMGGPSFNLSF